MEAETGPEGANVRDAVGCGIVLFEEGLEMPELKPVPEAERDGVILGVTGADVHSPGSVVVVAESVVKAVSVTVVVLS